MAFNRLAVLVVLTVACSSTAVLPSPLPGLVDSGPASARVIADDADLVLFYGAEQRGSMDTCGCTVSKRGSLARVQSVMEAASLVDADTPAFLVNAGLWLDDDIDYNGRPTEDAFIANRWMLEAMVAGRWDAMNVSVSDARYLQALSAWPQGAVSANLRSEKGRLFTVVERGGLRVGITGVARSVVRVLMPDGVTWIDPATALAEVIPEMEQESDLVVVLGFGLGKDTRSALAVPGIDVFVEADDYEALFEPFHVNEATWVRANRETKRLGELRVWLNGGVVSETVSRQIDLDDKVASDPELARMARQARRELER